MLSTKNLSCFDDAGDYSELFSLVFRVYVKVNKRNIARVPYVEMHEKLQYIVSLKSFML